nr:class I adenylate-forming enzyme family protein [Shimia biformata]
MDRANPLLGKSKQFEVLYVPELLGRQKGRAQELALIDPPNRQKITGGTPARLTWRDVEERVNRLAHALLSAGILPGQVIVTPAPTIHETILLQLAIIRIGAVVAPVPIQYREYELTKIAGMAKPAAFVGFDRLGCHANAEMLAGLASDLGEGAVVMAFGSNLPEGVISLDEWLDEDRPGQAERLAELDARFRPTADTLALIIFTSGSEAEPKAVPKTHRACAGLGLFLHDLAGLPDGGCILSPRMLNTAGGITTGLIPWLYQGARLVLHHPFDMDVFLQQIADEKPEYTSCPPAILHMILQRDDAGDPVDLGRLHHITSGSEALSANVVTEFKLRYGIDIVNVYGSSEGAMLYSSEQDVDDPDLRATSFPAFGGRFESRLATGNGIKTRLADPETGEEVTEAGVTGELEFVSPTLFSGYLDAPERTKNAFTDDGFYKTGDLFRYTGPEGRFLRFVGRSKNLIVRGGLNISAEEIMALVADHPSVKEAAIVGRPSKKLGQQVCAVVVLRPGKTLTLEGLNSYLKNDRRVSVFKLPEFLEIAERIPRAAGGKPDMVALRKMAGGE